MSDKEITRKCGFLDKIRYGDKIMADRGFNISEDLASSLWWSFMDSSIHKREITSF